MTLTSIREEGRLRGPSLATSKRAFVERYGTERTLLEIVNNLIGEQK